ncbi:GTP pyrophosphokinase [Gemmiger formicilis]|uniref:GTP pyrophosphokinase n=1 Tax=Gemmiger formicilis TaxID=745368 RepID=UPI0011C7F3E3|nr:hypothetical protein [Gemmiger formicilis]
MDNAILDLPSRPMNDLISGLEMYLQKAGLYFRIFGRIKSSASIAEKIKRKGYCKSGGHMQDLIGIRIALYFSDDVSLCQKIIEKYYTVDNISKTDIEPDKFSPERLNLVCHMPDDVADQFDSFLWDEYPIDRTFEIQIRTIFSEGWHEVEHDIRYKSLADWKEYPELSRNLNGVFATLETCDWAILSLINDLAYRQYKRNQWAQMIKTKMRIHLQDECFSDRVTGFLNENPDVGKKLYRADREQVLLFMVFDLKKTIPLTLENLVYIINASTIKDSTLAGFAPKMIQARLNDYFN